MHTLVALGLLALTLASLFTLLDAGRRTLFGTRERDRAWVLGLGLATVLAWALVLFPLPGAPAPRCALERVGQERMLGREDLTTSWYLALVQAEASGLPHVEELVRERDRALVRYDSLTRVQLQGAKLVDECR